MGRSHDRQRAILMTASGQLHGGPTGQFSVAADKAVRRDPRERVVVILITSLRIWPGLFGFSGHGRGHLPRAPLIYGTCSVRYAPPET